MTENDKPITLRYIYVGTQICSVWKSYSGTLMFLDQLHWPHQIDYKALKDIIMDRVKKGGIK
jgi:hypothetical protein